MANKSVLRSRASSGRQRSSAAERDTRGPPGGNSNSGPDRDRDSFSRWRERQYFGPRRWLESALRESSWEKDPGKNMEQLRIENRIQEYFLFIVILFFCSRN